MTTPRERQQAAPADTAPRGDDALVLALATGASWAEAAARSAVSESLIARRLRDPDFRGRISDMRRLLVERAVGKLSDASSEAADVLRQIAIDEAVQPGQRVAAARAILDLGARMREVADLDERIAALEALAEAAAA